MKKKILFLIAGLAVMLTFCTQPNKKLSSETYTEVQQKGEEITSVAQAALLANVGKAMQTGGTEYAISFCNLNASAIIDSLNQANLCVISRVSDKNRNPGNSLNGDSETELWQIFASTSLSDTVIHNQNELVYFKRIKIGMPACLQCHGTPGAEMDSTTFATLKKLYPGDLATGYQLNDFRGLWKVKFAD